MIKRAISIGLAACFALTLSGCGQKKGTDTNAETTATNVTVYEVGSDTISATTGYTGEIVAAENTSVSAKASGEATAVYVKEGDFVSAGTVLLSIDSTSYQLAYNQALASYNSAVSSKKSAEASKRNAEAARKNAEANYNSITGGSTQQTLTQLRAALDSAQIAYNNALDNYNKQNTLYSMGAISQMEFNSYQTALDNAKLNLDSATTNYNITKDVVMNESAAAAQAGIDSADAGIGVADAGIGNAQSGIESAKAALDIAKNNLDNCRVTAPISGYISAKNINRGQMVAQGSPLFTITNTSSVDAQINVTESVISRIQPGTKATIRVKSAGIENLEGNVSVVNPVKNAATGLYCVKISVPNADGTLKEGMIADITLITEEDTNAIIIPSDALLQEDNVFYVYTANGTAAEKHVVETGISNDAYTEILSGIQVGEKVIVKGKEYISEKNNEINIVTE